MFIILNDEESFAQFVRDSDPWLIDNIVEDLNCIERGCVTDRR